MKFKDKLFNSNLFGLFQCYLYYMGVGFFLVYFFNYTPILVSDVLRFYITYHSEADGTYKMFVDLGLTQELVIGNAISFVYAFEIICLICDLLYLHLYFSPSAGSGPLSFMGFSALVSNLNCVPKTLQDYMDEEYSEDDYLNPIEAQYFLEDWYPEEYDGGFFNYDIVSLLGVEIFLFVCILIIFLYSLISSTNKYLNMSKITIFLALLSLILSVFLTFFYSLGVSNLLMNMHFYCDDFTLFVKRILLLIIFFIFILALTYKNLKSYITYEFSILLLVSLWAMLLLLGSIDLIGIYLIIELQSFCFYILTATNTKSTSSTEAGLKYFILGSFSSGLLLFGISLLYGMTGLTNILELNILLSVIDYNNNIINLGLLLIIISILFKLGLAPFHVYVPDVYTGAPTIVTVLFLLVQKLVMLVVYLNLYKNIFIHNYYYLYYFFVFSILLSIIIGSISALGQSKFKRLISYSAIVNSGFLFIGIVLGTLDGVSSSLIFLIVYMILMLVLFAIFTSVQHVHNYNKLISFRDFILLKKSNLLLALAFALALFSIAGIPPLAGFYGKLFLFTAAVKEGSYALAIIAILFTVITAYYYILLIKIMFFETNTKFGFFLSISKGKAYIIVLGTLFNLLFFIAPKLLVTYINMLLLSLYY